MYLYYHAHQSLDMDYPGKGLALGQMTLCTQGNTEGSSSWAASLFIEGSAGWSITCPPHLPAITSYFRFSVFYVTYSKLLGFSLCWLQWYSSWLTLSSAARTATSDNVAFQSSLQCLPSWILAMALISLVYELCLLRVPLTSLDPYLCLSWRIPFSKFLKRVAVNESEMEGLGAL